MPRKSLENIIYIVNGMLHSFYLGEAKIPCKISPLAVFRGKRKRISIGKETHVYRNAHIECDSTGSIEIGSFCDIHEYARITTYGGSIIIGDYCSVNPFSILYGHGGLVVGKMVRIAAHVMMIPANHGTERMDIPIMQQEIELQRITIKDNVWIGAGAKILGGVVINSGAVIGANAVVTRDVPENAIVAGVPGRVIRYRGINNLES